jgi:2-hydroxychromene-2-carboxylate isomerase
LSTAPPSVDYYFTPASPWTYLGHARFAQIARAAGAAIRVLPVDLGKVFPVSGGLPLAKRAPQRQAYRLVELERFSKHLGLPITLKPKFFPVAADAACRLIIAVNQHDGADAAMRMTCALLAAVWAEERNIADAGVLAELLAECGLSPQRMNDSLSPAAQQTFDDNTGQAIASEVFGAPSWVVGGELFWGQDRLDFVERKLADST